MKFTVLYPKKGSKKDTIYLDIVLAFKGKKSEEQKRVFLNEILFKILVFA